MSMMRKVYLSATPSVDLDKVDGPIKPWDYRLKISVFEAILKEYDIKEGTDAYVGAMFLMLNNGPQLVEG